MTNPNVHEINSPEDEEAIEQQMGTNNPPATRPTVTNDNEVIDYVQECRVDIIEDTDDAALKLHALRDLGQSAQQRLATRQQATNDAALVDSLVDAIGKRFDMYRGNGTSGEIPTITSPLSGRPVPESILSQSEASDTEKSFMEKNVDLDLED